MIHLGYALFASSTHLPIGGTNSLQAHLHPPPTGSIRRIPNFFLKNWPEGLRTDILPRWPVGDQPLLDMSTPVLPFLRHCIISEVELNKKKAGQVQVLRFLTLRVNCWSTLTWCFGCAHWEMKHLTNTPREQWFKTDHEPLHGQRSPSDSLHDPCLCHTHVDWLSLCLSVMCIT